METQPLRQSEDVPPYTTATVKSDIPHRPSNGKLSGDDDSRFVCNVCLDSVKDPWLNTSHTTCPVCKAGVCKENVIPLFIRGSEQDPRTKVPTDVPNRPNARRPEPQIPSTLPNQNGFGMGGVGGGNHPMMGGAGQMGGLTFSTGFGFFPSLFGLQFQSFVPPAPSVPGRAPTREEEQQMKVSRMLVVIGIFAILCCSNVLIFVNRVPEQSIGVESKLMLILMDPTNQIDQVEAMPKLRRAI
eukprot:gene7109-14457_t